MDNKFNVNTNLFDYLGVLFIGLKLTGYIDWNWFWVLSPILFQLILIITMIIITTKLLRRIQ